MALNYDLREIKNFDKLDPAETQVMCFMTMFIEMNGINLGNADEWLKRAQLWEFVNGKMHNGEFTLDLIKKYVGLKTNVTTTSRTKWASALCRKYFDEGKLK